MDSHRLRQGLGWLSVGLGLIELTFAEGICRVLSVRRRAGLVRALGVRELITGLGLLSQQKGRPWLWGRVAGDAIDLSLLGATLNRPGSATGWRIAAIASVLGITLVDIYAAIEPPRRRVTGFGSLDLQGGPAESWRGSGLAEDIGAPQSGAEPEVDEEARQRRMRDAQHQLGLPDPEELSPRT
jgi:hypothetical protein